jgi:biopolymer transport protein ExbB
MIPITFMSVVVVAVGIERSLALRRSRVIPRDLVESLDELCVAPGGLDLRRAARVCADFPSAAATVVKSVLLKLGRPAAEVERAVADSMQREAERLYRHVRTLNLAATVTPLIGLLGTVWGMIQAFFVTANLPVGANKAQSLAEGIYIALVTTAGGLVVAIPAAMLAHVLEGRIQKLFVEIGEFIAQRLMPQVERLEGRVRIQRSPPPQAPPPPPVVESAGAK